LTPRERERDGKDRRKVDSKRKSKGEVRDTLFSERGERASFFRRFPGYARSSFW
jgi:hypothetical protein